MHSTLRSERISRAAPFLAAALLVLPIAEAGTGGWSVLWQSLTAQRLEFAFYIAPACLLDAGAVVAAALLLRRRSRGFAAVLGLVAVLVQGSAAWTALLGHGYRWSDYAPFGESGVLGMTWALATLAALAVVIRAEGWFPVRRPPPPKPRPRALRPRATTALDVVPAWAVHVGGGALVSLAATKIPSLLYFKCPDPWAPANVAMTALELGTGLLALFPRTRLAGAFAGALLMEGTAVFAWYEWVRGASWRGCGCFGSIDAPWPAHIAVAGAIGFVLAAAFVREATEWALSAPPEPGESPHPPETIAARLGAGLRVYRESGAREPWAAPAVAVVMATLAFPRALGAFVDVTIAVAAGRGEPFHDPLNWALFAAEAAAALCLLRPSMRRVGAPIAFVVTLAEFLPGLIASVAWMSRNADDGFPWPGPGMWFDVVVLTGTATACVLALRGAPVLRSAVVGRRRLAVAASVGVADPLPLAGVRPQARNSASSEPGV